MEDAPADRRDLPSDELEDAIVRLTEKENIRVLSALEALAGRLSDAGALDRLSDARIVADVLRWLAAGN